MCACLDGGPRTDAGNLPPSFLHLISFGGRVSHQAQSSPVWLVFLATLLCASPKMKEQGRNWGSESEVGLECALVLLPQLLESWNCSFEPYPVLLF